MGHLHPLAVAQAGGQGHGLEVRIGQGAAGGGDQIDDPGVRGQRYTPGLATAPATCTITGGEPGGAATEGGGAPVITPDADEARGRPASTGTGDGRTSHHPATARSRATPTVTAARAGSMAARTACRRSGQERGGSGRSSSGTGFPP